MCASTTVTDVTSAGQHEASFICQPQHIQVIISSAVNYLLKTISHN